MASVASIQQEGHNSKPSPLSNGCVQIDGHIGAYTLPFDSKQSTEKARVGGKGSNLGLLTQAKFPVPEGFNIATIAYREFVNTTGLAQKILDVVETIDYDDADDLELKTTRARTVFTQTQVPEAITKAIVEGYTSLGSSAYVAVRSSGTAEDLAEASFAGLHDTLLDIRGLDAVVEAVKECWASLWSARAVSYRHRNGFDHADVDIAVVVQRMVASEVSGVLFTGNPLTTATDELVVNASWGLGEAVVSGIVTPDNFVLKDGDSLYVRDRVLGTKVVKIRRDTSKTHGTVTEDVSEDDKARFSLTDEQLVELARIGLRVQDHYEGFPQDIEWGFENGKFYVLQSRPITGVEFSWDADCEDWQMFKEIDGTTWTRSLADENWTGAISPLMYSFRGYSWAQGHECAAEYWGCPELQQKRYWKFHKAVAYFNCDLEKDIVLKTIPPMFRPGLLANLPVPWRKEVQDATFSWWGYMKLYARVEALRPQVYKGFDLQANKWRNKHSTDGKGITREQLPDLSDKDLKKYTQRQLDVEDEYTRDLWTWFFINARDILTLLSVLLHHWYDPEDKTAFQALLTGTPRASETQKQNTMLWRLSQMIHKSPELRQAFEQNRDGAFFRACESSSDGQRFLAVYREFIELYGQRGMPDRDIYFPRRCEDPSIDYLALSSMLSHPDAQDPTEKEHETNRLREEFADEVMAKIQRSVFGLFKVELFKLVLSWCIEFVIVRDDERNFLDFTTLSIRWAFMEMARRLVEYGVFETVDDVWFLTKLELWSVWDNRKTLKMTPLTRAKITARRRDFERRLHNEAPLPPYLVDSAGADLDIAEEAVDGVHKGMGTAKGSVTATARVVRQLKDIGRVKPGEILVVNSTDPGWTPVFHIISGIVLETGGILAHGSCLAREYGLPAVQLARAMQIITDGAQVLVNGDMGTVTVLDEETNGVKEDS